VPEHSHQAIQIVI
jgi:AraC-like DNA-binding protein